MKHSDAMHARVAEFGDEPSNIGFDQDMTWSLC